MSVKSKKGRTKKAKGNTIPPLTPRQLVLLLFLCGSLREITVARITRGMFLLWKNEGENLPPDVLNDMEQSYNFSFLSIIFSDLEHLENCRLLVTSSYPKTPPLVKLYSPTHEGLFWARKLTQHIPSNVKKKIKKFKEWVDTVPFSELERMVQTEFMKSNTSPWWM